MEPLYFGDKSLSDVVINVADHDFHVHKMMLSNHSEYFRKLFYDGFDQVIKNRFEIKDVSPRTFRRILQFVYKGEVEDADSFMPCCRVCKPPWGSGPKIFWEETSEFLHAGDIFLMTNAVKNYVSRMVSKDACNNRGCWECFDGFIFSCAWGLDVVQRHKKYNLITINGWCNHLAKNVPDYARMDVKQLWAILNSIKIL